jgi:hypothetical protein
LLIFSKFQCQLDQIVEELEDRLGDSMNNVLDLVKGSLVTNARPKVVSPMLMDRDLDEQPAAIQRSNDWAFMEADDENMMYLDDGEGAGIEGDLDVEED